jgi:predicted lipid-binding transport protein (Tim44 family)
VTRRRLLIVVLAALALTAIVVPVAHASAGGGSAGFGGGGGGGGGGRGAGLYILIQILIRIAIFGHGLGALVLVGVVLLLVLFNVVAPKVRAFTSATSAQGRRSKGKTKQRQRRVELAAAEAADDDEAFDPETVRTQAANLFNDIQHAWDAGDRARLSALVTPSLMAEWNRRLDDFEHRGWRNRTQPLGAATIEYVGLTNRGSDQQDRVTVRVEAKLRDYVEDRLGRHIKRAGRIGETISIREFWTLAKRNGRWILASIEQGAEGEHALSDQITASAWSDDVALRDASLTELALQDAPPETVRPSELINVDFGTDARAAALDLSLADPRFSPDLLEIAARRAVDGWALAVDGDDAALLRVATPRAAEALLHPHGASTRLVVRGPRIRAIRIMALDPADPPTMTIEVDLTGKRYLEDRSTTAVLEGSSTRDTTFTERWKLALGRDATQPWRIVSTRAPAPTA